MPLCEFRFNNTTRMRMAVADLRSAVSRVMPACCAGQEPMERHPTVEYICLKEPKILETLIKGYEDEHNQVDALNSGMMLRECVKMEPLAKVIVNDEALFDLFFTYVQKPTFDIAADAFSTFKELLTAHKITCAEFLEKSYDRVFSKYKDLLNSENYVTRRQSLKLLGELLLDRANFTIMTKYVGRKFLSNQESARGH